MADTVNIPSELITEILYRLPAKSVGRFRCVSKSWLSLLSSPHFIKTHQKTFNQNHIIFVSDCDFSLHSLPVKQHGSASRPTELHCNFNNLKIHGSCNGLVLASCYIDDINKLIVLNPTTREFTELPQLPESRYEVNFTIFKKSQTFGLGYDLLTDDYKVVRISYYFWKPTFDNIGVHVYSLRSNAWKRVIISANDHSFLLSDPYGSSLFLNNPGVFVNGFLYWYANKGSVGSPVILAFNLADEKFSEVMLPNFSETYSELVDLGGKLGIFLESEGEVWLMKEYGVKEPWIKILRQKIYMVGRQKIFYGNGKIMLIGLKQMLIYDIEEQRFSQSFLVTQKQLRIEGSYVESLVSPQVTRIN